MSKETDDFSDEIAEKVAEKFMRHISEEVGKSVLKFLGTAFVFGLLWLAIQTGQIKLPGGH